MEPYACNRSKILGKHLSPLKIVDLSMDTGEVYLKWLELQESEDFIPKPVSITLILDASKYSDLEQANKKLITVKKIILVTKFFIDHFFLKQPQV